MKVIIVEDEQLAAENLQKLVLDYDPRIEIQQILDSVSSTIKWFSENPMPDLAFFDIQLADGLSFEIFDHVPVTCPVIFTTAYNEYAIKAFKVNSIDYLLKPLSLDELANAFNKYKNLKSQYHPQLSSINDVLLQLSNNYKKRFIVKVGEHIRSVPVEEILYFYSLEKATFMQLRDRKTAMIDYTMDQVENLVDPQQYFRINRKYIVGLDAFEDITTYSNSRLKLNLFHSKEMDAIVAREKVKRFKEWLDG